VIANPMSGSVAAAPSHNLERILVPSLIHRVLVTGPSPWRNSPGPEPSDINEALPWNRPHPLY